MSAQFWNRVARKYAASPIADMAGFETTLRRVGALLSPTHSVLEIGCGTGSTALRLAAGTRQWLATDLSPEMIAIAREKLADQPLPQLRFEVADAQAAVATSAIYDAVLAFNVLHLMSELDGALRAILPSLKPGGLFISKTPCLSEMNPLIRYAIPIAQFAGKAPYVSCFSAAELEGEIEAAGFTIIERARHGSTRKDARIFLVAQKPTDQSPKRG